MDGTGSMAEHIKEVIKSEKEYILDNCRACHDRTQEDSQIFIFTTVKLPDIYKETTSLDIHENDELPKVLCSTCYNRLLEAYNFRKMCSATALHFQKILSVNIPEENNNPLENVSNAQLMDSIQIKTEPDDSEALCSSLGNIHCSSEKEEYPSGISDKLSTDERLPEVLKTEPDDDDDAPLISRISQKARRKQEQSIGSQRKRKSITPRTRGHLICCICDSSFYRKSSLEIHMRVKHLGLKPCECKVCGIQLSRCGFKGHMEKYHGKKRRYPCQDCNSQYDSRWGLQLHMKSAHDPKNPKLLFAVSGDTDHEPEFQEDDDYFDNDTETCPGVPNTWTFHGVSFPVKNVEQALSFYRGKVNGTRPLSVMKNRFRAMIKTENDIRRLYEYEKMKKENAGLAGKVWVCEVCEKEFNKFSTLKIHRNTHGVTTQSSRTKVNTTSKKYVCALCGLKNATADDLRIHLMNIHMKDKVWSCVHCSYTARRKLSFDQHVKAVHQGVRDYKCPRCDRSFTSAGNMKIHMLLHDGIKRFTCTVCGLKKVSAGALNKHMNIHTREKVWYCDYCPYESTSKNTVERHEKSIHEGERNFHCPQCEQSFSRPRTLRNHMMIHTGEKPYTCTECGKSYIQEISLKSHMKIHDPLYVKPQPKTDRKYELWQRWWDAGSQ